MRLPDLTVSGTESNVLGKEQMAKLENLVLYSPAGNAVGAVEVSHLPPEEAVVPDDFVPLHSSGAAITIAADSAVTITEKGFESLIIVGTNTNVFHVSGQEDTQKGF